MTDAEAAYIEALTHVWAYHRTKLNEAMGAPHAAENAAERAKGTEP